MFSHTGIFVVMTDGCLEVEESQGNYRQPVGNFPVKPSRPESDSQQSYLPASLVALFYASSAARTHEADRGM